MGLQDFMKNLSNEENNNNKDNFSVDDILNSPENILNTNKEILENKSVNIDEMMIGDRKASAAMKGGQVTVLMPEKFEPEELGHIEFKRKVQPIEQNKEEIIKSEASQPTVNKNESKNVIKFNIKNNLKPNIEDSIGTTQEDEDILSQIEHMTQEMKQKESKNIESKNNSLIDSFLSGEFDNEDTNIKQVEKIETKKVETEINYQEQSKIKQEIKKPEPKPVETQEKPKQKSIEDMTETEKVNYLFEQSETPKEKREIWIDYYYKAQKSRKINPISQKMKQGRFTITMDDQVVIMPDMNVYGMTSDEILHKKWLNQ